MKNFLAAVKEWYEKYVWYGVSLIVVSLLVVVVFIFVNIQSVPDILRGVDRDKSADLAETVISIDPPSVVEHSGTVHKLRLIQEGRDKNGELASVDLTQDADWYADSSDVAVVGNDADIKGEVGLRAIGTGKVYALYNEIVYEADVTATEPPLTVGCGLYREMFIEEEKEVKVGEEVMWLGFYTGLGVPHYTYTWEGDDGRASTEAHFITTYDTPGEKQMHFETSDLLGQTAQADCSITVTN